MTEYRMVRYLDVCPECGAKLVIDAVCRIDVSFYEYADSDGPDYDFSGDWVDQYLSIWCSTGQHEFGRFDSLTDAARTLLAAHGIDAQEAG